MPKPICVQCELPMQQVESGVIAVEMFSKPPRPYKMWSSDLHRCPGCGHEILCGYGDNPIGEHFQNDFGEKLVEAQTYQTVIHSYERVADSPKVNPCN